MGRFSGSRVETRPDRALEEGRDPLTGALGRNRLLDSLSVALLSGPVAVCVVDLDHFRMVNDGHGHIAGDLVLSAIAAVIGERLRSTDFLGRVGSDEFAVVLPHTGLDAARRVADDLLSAIRSTRPGPDVRITASIGVAAADSLSAAELLAEADVAMVAAKELGRDRVTVAGAGERDRVRQSVGWAAAIRDALESGGFDVWEQPIVRIGDGEAPMRHELLVRLGGAAPAAFLPTAERFGQVQAIDGWVVSRALDLLSRSSTDILHVNLAPASIGDPELTSFIERAVVAAGVDPSRLVFEITESAAIRDVTTVAATARRLRGLGCGLALDDFGTGFASFALLRQLPFDVLKIAGDFVRGLHASKLDLLTVEAVVHIARGMGMVTVAEYVEDGATLEALEALDLDYAQGMYVGAPAPASARWPD
jgi:diguanylate cyclase (GGDEF)-like protein